MVGSRYVTRNSTKSEWEITSTYLGRQSVFSSSKVGGRPKRFRKYPRRVPHRTLRCDHFNSACCYGLQSPRYPIDVLPELRTVWWMRSVTMADNACAKVYASVTCVRCHEHVVQYVVTGRVSGIWNTMSSKPLTLRNWKNSELRCTLKELASTMDI